MSFFKLLFAIACVGLVTLQSPVRAQTLSERLLKEGIVPLAKAARTQGDAIRGSVLLPRQELGCANCHLAGNQQLSGPDLTRMGKQVTDEYLVESLLAPSKTIKKGFESVTILTKGGKSLVGRVVKRTNARLVLRVNDPGRKSTGRLQTVEQVDIEAIKQNKSSAMPDDLVNQLASRQEFLDLIKYLIKLAETDPGTSQPLVSMTAGQPLSQAMQGSVLIDRFRCELCHGRQDATKQFSLNTAPYLPQSASWIQPDYLERFIINPAAVKPGTSMPDMMGRLTAEQRKTAAVEIRHYLVSLARKPPVTAIDQPMKPERGQELFHSVGCVACHAPRDPQGQELTVAGSVPLGNLREKYALDGLTAFLKNPHAVRPGGRMPDLQLTHWEARDIAAWLTHTNAEPDASPEPTAIDPELVKQGKTQFQYLGCAKCHAVDNAVAKADQKVFSQLNVEQGCLSAAQGKWPRYEFSADEIAAIQSAIQNSNNALNEEQQVHSGLALLNCYACHQHNGKGGVTAEREDWFKTTNPNLGPQGRIPPALTGVGTKLQAKALRDVLVSGHKVRPYMQTRMPRFGADNVEFLIKLLSQSDERLAANWPKGQDQKLMRNAGAELAGEKGLNCIACHTFQFKPAKTMPAVDLTLMGERYQPSWFDRYLRNPQQFHPGTVMPSFWPGGQSLRKDVLNGNADLQIAALWEYLKDGRQARAPQGLISKPMEILATNEAVMLRRSYPGIGKRGIGVGYPGEVNIAFDAEQMRLAMIWTGKFVDPGGVWRSQGHGRVRPLGRNQVSFPVGPELEKPCVSWSSEQDRPPHHQFRGYTLDDKQRPTFQYEFHDVQIEDSLIELVTTNPARQGLQRTVTLTSGKHKEPLRFRVDAGKKIVGLKENTFLIDERLRIRIVSGQSAELIEAGDIKQLEIAVDLSTGKTQLKLEYDW